MMRIRRMLKCISRCVELGCVLLEFVFWFLSKFYKKKTGYGMICGLLLKMFTKFNCLRTFVEVLREHNYEFGEFVKD